jgi:hypothetical protein
MTTLIIEILKEISEVAQIRNQQLKQGAQIKSFDFISRPDVRGSTYETLSSLLSFLYFIDREHMEWSISQQHLQIFNILFSKPDTPFDHIMFLTLNHFSDKIMPKTFMM